MLALLLSLMGSPAQAADAGSAPAEQAATEMLDAALADLAAGRLSPGCSRLELLAKSWPDSPDAQRANQLARIVNGLEPRYCAFAEGSIEIATDGRTELIVSQAVVWPIWFTAAAPLYFPEATNFASVGGLILVGLGVGIGGTYLATRDLEVSTGQALTIYTAELLGVWYGAWLEGALADNVTGRPAHLGMLAGAGLGIGLAAQFKDASAGDVALVRSGAIWGTAIGGLVAVLGNVEGGRTVLITLGAGTSAGLALTTALTSSVELRRRQVNVINLGGYAGALVGGAVAIIFQAGDARTAAALIALGAGGGLGIGAYVATQQDRRRSARNRVPTPRVGMVADPQGRLHPGVTMSGRW